MLYVGIDQHRKQLTVNVRDESGASEQSEILPANGTS